MRWNTFSRVGNRKIHRHYIVALVVVSLLFMRFYLLEFTVVSSNSMMPTLAIGDYVLIKKYTYGVENPFTKKKLFQGVEPKRGELVVFTLPVDPERYYIKRVIGVPGDHITYENNTLEINSEVIQTFPIGRLHYHKVNTGQIQVDQFIEHLGSAAYKILDGPHSMHAKNSDWVVPEGHYFFLGDNRDDSQDSRFIGYIPHRDLIGEPIVLPFLNK